MYLKTLWTKRSRLFGTPEARHLGTKLRFFSPSSLWGMDHAACSDGVWHTLNQDDNAASILRAGFEAVPMLISRNLAADILESVPMAKAQIISNALQQAVQGDLRRRVDEELQSSSALAGLVESVFGVRTFQVKEVKRLTNPYEAPPQIPHADDYCNRKLIGVVQLRDGQRPTEALAYDPSVRLPTGLFLPCSSCGVCGQVGDAELRRREADATRFQCDECACGLDGSTLGPSDLAACERVFVTTVFTAFAPLLERHGSTLQAVHEAMRPCGGPEAACGDAVIALPTLIHRGPGNPSKTETRDVLFFELHPVRFGATRGLRSKVVPVPPVSDGDLQVSAPWLLTLGQRTGLLGRGLYERVEASYALHGIVFTQFLVDEKVQPSSKKKSHGGGLVSVFRPLRKRFLSTSSYITGSKEDKASEAEATFRTEGLATVVAPSARPQATKHKRPSAATYHRCGTFGCTLPDRHPGLHAFTADEIRPRRSVLPSERTQTTSIAKRRKIFDICGTFGCTLPDRHPGLHFFSVDDTRPRQRRMISVKECQAVPAGPVKSPAICTKTAQELRDEEQMSNRTGWATAMAHPMHRRKSLFAENFEVPPMRMNMDACEPEKDHMWPFPVLIPPERLLTSSSSASW